MKRSNEATPQLISLKEASQILNIHPNTLRRWDNIGLLKAVRMGARKDRSYSVEDISKFTSNIALFKPEIESSENGNQAKNNPGSSEAAKRLDQVQLISAALSKLLTVQEVVNFITNHIVSLLNADKALLMMVSEDWENLEIAGFHNLTDLNIKRNSRVSLQEPFPSVEAIKYGQVIIIESAEEMHERFPDVFNDKNLVAAQARAYVALPLETPSQKFGAIGIGFSKSQRFSKDDISFLYYLARTYAQALERAVFYEQKKKENELLKKSLELLEVINSSALQLLNHMSLEETYGMIVSESQRITRAEYASIFILDGDRLERVYASDKSLYKIKARKRGDTYSALRTQEAKVYYVKPENDPHPMLNRFGIKSVLRVPLLYKNRSFGVINMLFKKDVDLSDQELEIYQLFGSLSALAIFNAKKE